MFKIKPGWIVVSLSVLLLFGCLPKNEEGKETWNPLNWGSTLEMPDGDSKNLGSELFTLDYEPKTGIRANGEDELTLRATIPRDASDGFYTITFKTNHGSLSSTAFADSGSTIMVRVHKKHLLSGRDTVLTAEATLRTGTVPGMETMVSATSGSFVKHRVVDLSRNFAEKIEAFRLEESEVAEKYVQAKIVAKVTAKENSGSVSQGIPVKFSVDDNGLQLFDGARPMKDAQGVYHIFPDAGKQEILSETDSLETASVIFQAELSQFDSATVASGFRVHVATPKDDAEMDSEQRNFTVTLQDSLVIRKISQ